MKLGVFLRKNTSLLSESGIGTARLELLVLLEDCLKKDRSYILAHPEIELSSTELAKLNRQVKRRSRHEPLAYIRGFSEFYGRKFKVNKYVLEPRSESETIIDLLKGLSLPALPSIADVGTGSGCLGITAAIEITGSVVDLYDIDSSALAVAKHNSTLHELPLKTRKMNLLSRPLREYDVILANLPYVPKDWKINRPAKAEPRIAIFGGKDGLDVYRSLFTQLRDHRWQPKFVLTETLPPQHAKLAEIAREGGFELCARQDFIQVFAPAD